MNTKLFTEALLKLFAGVIAVGLLIFLPAGTLYFINGILLMTVLFVPMLTAGIIMMLRCPELLKRRLKATENDKKQGLIVILSGIIFTAGFIVAGLDFRFALTNVPKSAVITAVFVFITAYLLYGEVIRENAYLSRTIEVQENQKVIDTGLYSIVRHPMYSATILLFLSMPIILGSFWSFLIFLLYPFLIVKRIKLEEEFLKSHLCGYAKYTKKVKYRLFPFIW